MMKKTEYLIFILISLALLEFGLLHAWGWYWSGFQWSPLGYETCGLEFLAFPLIVWPGFILAELIRLGLFRRWKFPAYVWWGPPFLCGIAATAICKCLSMGIYCILVMVAVPVIDFWAFRKAARRVKTSK